MPYEVLIKVIGAQLDALTRTVNQLAKLGILSPQQGRRSSLRCYSWIVEPPQRSSKPGIVTD